MNSFEIMRKILTKRIKVFIKNKPKKPQDKDQIKNKGSNKKVRKSY